MREFTFLEKLAEDLLEGGFIRALKPKLQPVQLAKALAREMNRSQMVGPDAPLVANLYSIYLSIRDFAQFSGFQSNLERELAAYLRSYAARRGYRPIAAISVELKESTHLKAGQVRTEGKMVDRAPSAPPSVVDPAEAERMSRPSPLGSLQGTMEMPAIRSEGARPSDLLPAAGQPPAALVGRAGEAIPLARPETSIGRAVDNDVVLEDKSVSRRHAHIAWESGQYLLEDLGSTNGTFVSGKRIARHPLADGDELSFGGVQFIFRQSRG